MNELDINDLPPMLDVAQAAAYLRVGKQAVYSLSKEPDFPSLIIGGKIRIPRDNLKQWVQKKAMI